MANKLNSSGESWTRRMYEKTKDIGKTLLLGGVIVLGALYLVPPAWGAATSSLAIGEPALATHNAIAGAMGSETILPFAPIDPNLTSIMEGARNGVVAI